MDAKKSLTLVSNAEGYFHEQITQTLKAQRVQARPETEFYLVNLLGRYVLSDRFSDEPLVFLWKDALEQAEAESQREILRKMGDQSLYVAGFFQESLNKKMVDVDYYVAMGGKAYRMVAGQEGEPSLKTAFAELSEKFKAFVDVLAEVGEQSFQRSEQDLLRIYEQWIENKNGRAERKLKQAGILPTENTGKKLN